MTPEGESLTPEGESLAAGKISGRLYSICRKIEFNNEVDPANEKIWEQEDGQLKQKTHEILLKGVSIYKIKLEGGLVENIEFKYSQPVIQWGILISGALHDKAYEVNNLWFNYPAHGQGLVFAKETTGFKPRYENEKLEAFVIHFTLDFFLSYLPEESPMYKALQYLQVEKTSGRPLSQTIPINTKVIELLEEIFNYQNKECYKRLYVKAKILEMLSILFVDYEREPGRLLEYGPVWHGAGGLLKEEEIRKMYFCRELMLKNFEKPLSLNALSRLAGTNEYNLKKHFKLVFGTTVFGYLHDYKMNKAREMLQNGSGRIADIAESLGYKHATHFTSAFKKYFGFLPGKLRE